tara:strand:+ start:1280 stop:1519 length:240 start_codon:yes stop_codon:yes gene_type:complete
MEEKKKNVNKRKRFTDLAPIRVNNVLKHLRLVGNMTNKNNYSYDSSEFKKILNDISEELNLIKSKLNAQENKRDKKWKL